MKKQEKRKLIGRILINIPIHEVLFNIIGQGYKIIKDDYYNNELGYHFNLFVKEEKELYNKNNEIN